MNTENTYNVFAAFLLVLGKTLGGLLELYVANAVIGTIIIFGLLAVIHEDGRWYYIFLILAVAGIAYGKPVYNYVQNF